MFIRRSASGVCVSAPAKLNLFFEILARRADGFHEIETLMVPASLADRLTLQSTNDGDVTLNCRWAYLPSDPVCGELEHLPEDDKNLVVRAVKLLRSRAGVEFGAKIELWKRIPSAAGLGGGSSDAAAALVAANLVWNLGWSRERLASVAAELGSDIPFFLYGGTAICRGRGELVEPVPHLPALHLVIVKPNVGLSTPAVYRACRVAEQPKSVASLLEALKNGETFRGGQLLHNQLQTAAATLSEWPDRLHREFSRTDCWGHQQSGSGTSYFGLCRNAAHARRVAARLGMRNVGRVMVVHTVASNVSELLK